MHRKQLHIVGNHSLIEKISSFTTGEISSWNEMLCQGPTIEELGSEEFFKVRKKFYKDTYLIDALTYEQRFISTYNKLQESNKYTEINLWFAYDLYSQLNLIALVSYLMEQHSNTPIYVICNIPKKDKHQGARLISLTKKELQHLYRKKIRLTGDDMELANLIWLLYCGNNPQKLKQGMLTTKNFEYAPIFMQAHLQRFPSIKSGLSSLEEQMLQLIASQKITSHEKLIEKALSQPSLYGYNKLQIMRLLDKLSPFYHYKKSYFELNENGKLALNHEQNFYRELKDDMCYGGTMKYDFLYNEETRNLLKL